MHAYIIIFREDHQSPYRSKMLMRSPTVVIFHLSSHACQIIFREDHQIILREDHQIIFREDHQITFREDH